MLNFRSQFSLIQSLCPLAKLRQTCFRYFKDAVRLLSTEAKTEQENLSLHMDIVPGQKRRAKKKPVQPPDPQTIKVAILGAPNAGKSTLLNQLIGWKVAPVSEKVHTTRQRTLGIYSEGNRQIVYLDTPGIINARKRKKHNLEKSLLHDPHSVLFEADIVAVVVDVSNVWSRNSLDKEVLKALYLHQEKQSVLILNKVDILRPKKKLLKTTRILTEGVVMGTRQSHTEKELKKKMDIKAMFDGMEKKHAATRRVQENSSQEQGPIDKYYKNQSENINAEYTDSSSRQSESLQIESKVCSLQQKTIADQGLTSAGEEMNEKLTDFNVDQNKNTNLIHERGRVNEHTIVGPLPENLSNKSEALVKRNVTIEYQNGLKKVVPPDFTDNQVWNEYYTKLCHAEIATRDKKGWPHFSKVFMISALNGSGVDDIKDFFLQGVKPSPWEYDGSVVTDMEPMEMARQCIWEKVLDHSPKEVPYQIQVDISLWDVDDDNMLRVVADVICQHKRQSRSIMGKNGETARRIAAEAKQSLMNSFKRDLTLKLVVKMVNQE